MTPLWRRTLASVVVLVWLGGFASGAAQSDLFEIAMRGSLSEVRDAVAEVPDVDIRNDRSLTPLMYAAFANPDPEVVRWLVSVGADVDAASDDGETPLTFAIGWNPEERVALTLIELGARVNTRTSTGITPLMRSASTDRGTLLEALLAAGANVDARQADGVTALMYAAANAQAELVEALIATGANVALLDTNGMSALMYAAAWAVDPQSITRLVSAGADVHARTTAGWSVIELAVTSKDSTGETIRALVDAGAAIDTVNAFGLTLLMQAAMFDVDPTVVDALLDAGVDATLRSDDGRRAIDYVSDEAALRGSDAYWRLNDASF